MPCTCGPAVAITPRDSRRWHTSARSRSVFDTYLLGTPIFSQGPLLKRLRINPWRNHLEMYYAIDLGENTNLKSVHFGRIKPFNQLSGLHIRKPLVWMQMMLSQIKSSQMEELRFLIEVDFFHDLNQIDWIKLADLFTQPRFSGLKKIRFDVQRVGCVNASSAEEWIKPELLPGHSFDS
ncbi:hypothetical protein PILCRDRAFT_90940 [Piloderma croceum F 1598]|uniref:Uncharacterized protein n=1 Tax=Piloderma croceum (strain F 1598) TaxID=765440 RepID=A0A0C3FD73_PILCF|nr:hypothetical protein PILCRDRAFT_90940 [Piloderma croceum F 1598]